jgi:hypothetical protein
MTKAKALAFCFLFTAYFISGAQSTPQGSGPVPVKTANNTVQKTVPAPKDSVKRIEKLINTVLQEISDTQFLTAMHSLLEVRAEVNKLWGQEVEKALPQKIDGWEMTYNEELEKEVFIYTAPNPAMYYMVRIYFPQGQHLRYDTIWDLRPTPPSPPGVPQPANSNQQYNMRVVQAKQEKITLSISNCPEFADAIGAIYSPSEDNLKRLMFPANVALERTVNGNRAFMAYSKETGQAEFAMYAGTSVIKITGVGIKDPSVLETIAAAINFKLLDTRSQLLH